MPTKPREFGVGILEARYSKDGINGPYGTAITQDGVIVADFITAGILQGIKIRAVDNNFIVEMYDGKIRFIKKMEQMKQKC